MSVCTVAVCAATGQQGRELIRRFQHLNEKRAEEAGVRFRVRGLTRDVSSASSKKLAAIDCVTMVAVDYASPGSLDEAIAGADAIYVNYALGEDEASAERRIVDAALRAGVKHIVYSSTIACSEPHGVPHWSCSFQTEEHLKKMHACRRYDFKYHFLRLGHFNENLLPGSYFPPKGGRILYPWRTDKAVHTSSLKDVARAACKLIAEPGSLENGSYLDATTEFRTPDEFASAIAAASGVPIEACKGPWIFLTFGRHFGWEASSILLMSRYIGTSPRYTKSSANLDHLPGFLRDELAEEPLETIEEFAKRHYSGNRDIGKKQWLKCLSIC